MGATDYAITVEVKPSQTAADALRQAAEQDRYENGHGCYQGTIGQACGLTMKTFPKGTRAASKIKALNALLDGETLSQFGLQKSGPAACADLGLAKTQDGRRVRRFYFVGFAAC